mmetsp:Transcript_62767/g.70200  ORF Transcript_62767/g.70200 Transcript_62767/m.70200 type:complete len:108 (+) Transcript_62767:1702-2025(+)
MARISSISALDDGTNIKSTTHKSCLLTYGMSPQASKQLVPTVPFTPSFTIVRVFVLPSVLLTVAVVRLCHDHAYASSVCSMQYAVATEHTFHGTLATLRLLVFRCRQ